MNALLSSTLVIEREVQNLAALISHPIPLRHLRELASKLEVLSDMLLLQRESIRLLPRLVVNLARNESRCAV